MARKKPYYRIIFEDLLNDIKTGKYTNGDQLPTEKDLSGIYNVSRITSKKALDMLLAMELINRIPGKGSFVILENGMLEKHLKEKSENKVNNYTNYPKEVVADVFTTNTNNSKTKLIGLIIEDFAESFGTHIVSGIERVLSREGYLLLVRRSYGKQSLESEAIREMMEAGVWGLLIFPVHGDKYSKDLLKLSISNFPVVLVDRELKGIPLSFVGTDNYNSTKNLINYLFDQNHKKIGLVAPESVDTSSVSDRIAAFQRCHSEHSILIEKQRVIFDMKSTLPSNQPAEIASDLKKLERFLLNNPDMTAVFAIEYNIACAIRKAAKNINLRIPEDLEIVCFDSPSSNVGYYDFTHIHQDEEKIGELAAKNIINQVEKSEPDLEHLLVPGELILRNDMTL